MPAKPDAALSENAAPVPISQLAVAFGTSPDELRRLLRDRGDRVRQEFRLGENPFSIDHAGVQTRGVAGVLRIATGMELEIAPKCLDVTDSSWREDFLVLAVLTRLGRVLGRERVAASLREQNRDVVTLLAAAFLDEYERLSPIPIREYKRSAWIEPSLDGEIDYAEVWEPRAEGFAQVGPRFTNVNSYMSTIAEAAVTLASATADRGIGERLRRPFRALPTPMFASHQRKVPGRYARWQYLYDLALAVLDGFGLQLRPDGLLRGPGFAVNTERGWEDLISFAMMAQGTTLRAKLKPRSTLGTRRQGTQPVYTYPDIVLRPASSNLPIVVDAKYKGTAVAPIRQVGSADLYEAIAFLESLDARTALLIYPGTRGGDSASACGALSVFDEVVTGKRTVIGATVDIHGLGARDGLMHFANRLTKDLLEICRVSRLGNVDRSD